MEVIEEKCVVLSPGVINSASQHSDCYAHFEQFLRRRGTTSFWMLRRVSSLRQRRHAGQKRSSRCEGARARFSYMFFQIRIV